MKKKTQPTPAVHHEKGFLALAGEAFHVLGEEIIEGKNKVVEVASEKFTAVKEAIKNAAHKKQETASRPVKKSAKKAAPKKAVKKAVGKAPVAAKKIVKAAKKKARVN